MNNSNSKSDIPQISGIKYQSNVISPLKKEECNIQYGSVTTAIQDNAPLMERKNQNTCINVYNILCTLTIEPVVFCYMLAFVMNLACMSNMMMDKSCLYHFNYSAELCKNLSDPEYKDEKDKVEISATNFSLYFNCMGLIGAFCMIFIAPWSDKYGRKIPLFLALLGATVTDVGFILCSMYFELPNEYLLWSKIPAEIFGGFVCVLTIFFSHASEVSTEQYRTMKYAFVQTAFGLGISLGGMIGGILYQYYGYVYIYVNAAVLHMFCIVWVIFVVEETTGLNENAGWCKKIKDLFVCQNMKEGVKATFKRRGYNQRALILLLMGSMCVIVLTYESFSSLAYVYVHHIYNWDPATYNYVITSFSLLQLPVTILLVPVLIRLYKMNDFTFGVIGTLSMLFKNLLISFAKYHTFIYYIGNAVGVFSGLCMLAVRSSISKIVEKEELGRVFSFLATCEAIIPTFGTVALANIFTVTLNITPNIAYLVSSVSLLLPLLTFTWAIKYVRQLYHSIPSNDTKQEKA